MKMKKFEYLKKRVYSTSFQLARFYVTARGDGILARFYVAALGDGKVARFYVAARGDGK